MKVTSQYTNACILALLYLCNHAESYGHQTREILEKMTRDKFHRYFELHSKNQPQPQVKCYGNGKVCKYTFTVTRSNDVSDLCATESDDVTTVLKEMKQEMTELKLLIFDMKEEQRLQDDMKAEEARETKRQSARDIYVDTTVGQLCYNVSEPKKQALRDCQDVMHYLSAARGVYKIHPTGSPPFYALCEDGWTILQHREDGTEDFDRSWDEYRDGFGSLNNEFWLGNDNIHYLTSQKKYKLQIELGDWNGKRANAIYESFSIENENSKYTARIGEFITGTAGDGLRTITHGGSADNMRFSTWDRDYDRSGRNCAVIYEGGWWYNDCFFANLNGEYVFQNSLVSDSFVWRPWKGPGYSLKISKIMVKPT